MIPIISNDRLYAENEMLLRMNPEEIIPWANRWLAEYSDIPREVIQQLSPVFQNRLMNKYLLAQRISKAPYTAPANQLTDEPSTSRSRNISKESYTAPATVASPNPVNQLTDEPSTSRSRNISTGSYTAPTTVASPNPVNQLTDEPSTSISPLNVASLMTSISLIHVNAPANQLTDEPSTSRSRNISKESYTAPATVASPNPVNQLTDEPSTSRSGNISKASYTAPATVASSNPVNQLTDEPSTSRFGNIATKRRITYDAYSADPRKRVLREMNIEANRGSTSTDMQRDNHAAPNGGASDIASTESNIIDSGNNSSIPHAPSPPMASSTPLPMPSPLIVIGPNGTKVPIRKFNAISFTSSSAATRKLLCMIFPEEVLATHTLTGKPSPAFVGRERPPKGQLDPKKVEDIIQCVIFRTSCSDKSVRTAITNKCADSAKKFRRLGMTPMRRN